MAISARTTAHKIAKAANARLRENNLTRFQISAKGIGELSGRQVVDHDFMRTLASELSGLGWTMFQITSTAYGVISSASAQGFRKISAKVILGYNQRKPDSAPEVEQEGSVQVDGQEEGE